MALERKDEESTALKDLSWFQITPKLYSVDKPPVKSDQLVSWDEAIGPFVEAMRERGIDYEKQPFLTTMELKFQKDSQDWIKKQGATYQGESGGVPTFTQQMSDYLGYTLNGNVVLRQPEMNVPTESGEPAVGLYTESVVPTLQHEKAHVWATDVAGPQPFNEFARQTGYQETIGELKAAAPDKAQEAYQKYEKSPVEAMAFWQSGKYGEPDPNSKYIGLWNLMKQYQAQPLSSSPYFRRQ